MNTTPVTVLGLGAMGTAIATTLLDGGHRVTVWNRTPARAEAMAEHGAAVAATAREAIAASPLAIVCVTDYPAARDIADSVGDSAAGRTVANVTTTTPDEANMLATWAQEHAADYLDGALQALPAQIGTPDATILFSGSRAVFDTHRTPLERLGTVTHVSNEPGAASLHFLALLGLWYETETAYLRALALARAAEVEPETFAPFAAKQLGYVVDEAVGVAREVTSRHYPRGPATLTEHEQALDQVLRLQRAHHVDSGQLNDLTTLVRRLIDNGHGDDGYTRLIESFAADGH